MHVFFFSQVNEIEKVPIKTTLYQWTFDERYRPTEPTWSHVKVSIHGITHNETLRNDGVYQI